MTFSDGDFASANWTFVEIERNEGGSVISQVTTNGTPGNALEIELSLDAAVGFSLIMGVWLWHEPYDPSMSGGFASVRHAEDAIYLAPGRGDGHATGVALRQNDSVFTSLVGFTPNQTWTPIMGCGLIAGDFSRVSGGGSLDFSSSGAPIEVGFYRAISQPSQGGGSGSRTGAIDNWSLTLVPGCTGAADCAGGDGCVVDACVDSICECEPIECDDGDACTTDACTGGTCTSTPMSCDDGNDCTADSCVNGICLTSLLVDLGIVETKLQQAIDAIEASPCADEPLVKKVRKRLKKKIKKALKKLARTDDVTKDRILRKLFGKSDLLLIAAQSIVEKALGKEKISPACATTLRILIGELQFCAGGLARPS